MAHEPRSDRARERRRRRALDEVFGQVLPETTADERDPDTRWRRDSPDDWYRENRPPHHDH